MKRFQHVLGAAAAVFLTASVAMAAESTDTMVVSSSVGDNCVIAADNLGFGAYDPVAANATTALDGTAVLTVTCTDGAAAEITIDAGQNGDGIGLDVTRAMLIDGATDTLSYQLYTDTGRSTVWGTDAGTGVTYAGTGLETTETVYGQIPAGQNVPKGTYEDTVAVTITY